MAKACASHGSRNTGPSASRGIAGKASSRSGRFKIRLPAIDRDGERRIGIVAPKLGPREDDGIDPLRVFAATMRIGVREYITASTAFDDPKLAARIARQPRVPGRMKVARPHPISRLKK